MNAQGRKELAGYQHQCQLLLEQVRDDEQEKFDNMPEGLQQGEKGQAIEEAVNTLTSLLDKLEEEAAEHDLP